MLKSLCTGALAFLLIGVAAHAGDYPAPQEADWIARDFKFHTGEVMGELRLHYTTIGVPSGQPVLLLHGTGSSRNSPANCSARARRSTPANISSSCRMRSGTAVR